MAVCINKNSIEYQLLKDRAGISEFTLEAICRDFTEKYGRFPHLDELPNSNSELSLRDTFKIKENNGVKISDLLEITGKGTVELATIDINNQYRDLEVKILPIVEEAIVDVAHRPIDNNFENLTEEEKILAKAPRDKNGNLLAPNGKPTNLNERQWLQVRTKAFKKWFGDWEKEYTPQTNIYKENPWERYMETEDTGRTYVGHSGKTIPIIINKGIKYVHPVERITTTDKDPFGFNSYNVNNLIIVGKEVDADRNFNGICQVTARACKDFLKNRYNIESSVVIIKAKSPVKDDIIDHWVNVLSINGEAYIYDMPQTEYIKQTKPLIYDDKELNGYYEGVIVSKYTPRLIKVTEENLSKFYKDNNQNNKQIQVIKDTVKRLNKDKKSINLNDLQYKPAYDKNVSKVVDENGEPLVVYHGSTAKFNTFDKSKNKKGYWKDANGNTIESDTNNTFFFSSNKAAAKSYALLNTLTGAEISDSGINTINKYSESIKYIAKLTSNDVIEKYEDIIRDAIKDIGIYRGTTLYKNLREENISGSLALYKGKLMLGELTLEGLVYKELPPKFFKDAIDSIKLVLNKRIESYSKPRTTWDGKQVPIVDINEDVYPVFLNIRNPFSFDYEGANINSKYKEKYPIEYINARQVAKAIKEKHDGVIYNNIVDPYLADNYGVFNPNQIKSAESNSGSFNKFNKNIYDAEPNGYLVLNNALQKLASLYGITFNEVTDAELNSEEWSNLIPDAQSVNAFVYNGQIYINMDRANLDAPIHEMFHILVGSMRFENPTLYTNLISSVENLYNYSALAELYPNRSRNDVNEEIFITELSKYFSGLPSLLMNLDLKSMHELTYNIIRTLDSILMGEDSVRTVSEDRLYNMSFKTLINEVNSTIATSKFTGFINMEGSELHRKLNNIKSDLLKNKQLEEICD